MVAKELGVADALYLQAEVPGGPAALAGLRTSDVVALLDNRPATSTATLGALP
ncbi:hypothetical protein [Arthrobacter sp. UYCu511]|uniref:hypothetical protein n=1 Tax=Arthrobacter sp. UYCu511 TaxID=3156337 RepID=UPI003397197D